MAGVYREKQCPNCATSHRKKGKFCSIGCSNSYRKLSPETIEKHRQNALDYALTPEGVAKAAAMSRENTKKGIDNDKRRNGEYVSVPEDWMMHLDHEDDDGLVL